jgi:microcin C transport system substrate-binding protein
MRRAPSTKRRLDIPLGSGPYKVGKFEVNRYIEYERVKDWWAADLPVCRGSYNFDVVRYEFYRDRDVAFEGFTGKNYLYREEFTSRIWATRYDFPASRTAASSCEVCPTNAVGRAGLVHQHAPRQVQGPARARGADLRFDFEWTNKTVMYGAYARTVSPFQNSDIVASRPAVAGRAEAARAVSRPGARRSVRRAVSAAGVGRLRAGSRLLRKASQLLSDAGSSSRTASGCCRTARSSGSNSCSTSLVPAAPRPFLKNLGTLGIEATCGSSMPCISAPASRISTLTSPAPHDVGDPGDAMRPYFSSQARQPRGRTTLPASPSPHRCADREDLGGANRARLTAPAAPSTACSAPAVTGCRNGIAPRTAGLLGRVRSSAKLPRYDRLCAGVGERNLWWYDAPRRPSSSRRNNS